MILARAISESALKQTATVIKPLNSSAYAKVNTAANLSETQKELHLNFRKLESNFS